MFRSVPRLCFRQRPAVRSPPPNQSDEDQPPHRQRSTVASPALTPLYLIENFRRFLRNYRRPTVTGTTSEERITSVEEERFRRLLRNRRAMVMGTTSEEPITSAEEEPILSSKSPSLSSSNSPLRVQTSNPNPNPKPILSSKSPSLSSSNPPPLVQTSNPNPLATASQSFSPSAPSIPTVMLSGPWLRCPSCEEFWESIVYQCIDGHSVCSRCCETWENRCPFCEFPIGFNMHRNTMVENMLEESRIECINKMFGCLERPFRSELRAHIIECEFDYTFQGWMYM